MDRQVLKHRSQQLRKEMTAEERHLWYDFLKSLPVTVKRQQVFGNYIADFYISAAKLVIELDGSQHYEENGQQYDAARDETLRKKKLTVLRFSNLDVNQQFEAVCESILLELRKQGVSV